MNILHQTSKNNELNEFGESCKKNMQVHHPDWEYKMWTDEDLKDLMINLK